MHAHTHSHTHIQSHTHTQIHTHRHINTHTHTHTHTHTQTFPQTHLPTNIYNPHVGSDRNTHTKNQTFTEHIYYVLLWLNKTNIPRKQTEPKYNFKLLYTADTHNGKHTLTLAWRCDDQKTKSEREIRKRKDPVKCIKYNIVYSIDVEFWILTVYTANRTYTLLYRRDYYLTSKSTRKGEEKKVRKPRKTIYMFETKSKTEQINNNKFKLSQQFCFSIILRGED